MSDRFVLTESKYGYPAVYDRVEKAIAVCVNARHARLLIEACVVESDVFGNITWRMAYAEERR